MEKAIIIEQQIQNLQLQGVNNHPISTATSTADYDHDHDADNNNDDSSSSGCSDDGDSDDGGNKRRMMYDIADSDVIPS